LFGLVEDENGEPQAPPARSLFAPIWRLARDRIEIIRHLDESAADETSPSSSERRIVSADYAWRPPADSTRIDPM
jgi:hypothetical protein